MGKLPAFQFYPNDWLADTVAGCSLAAQGLWLRMMIVMHSSERRGYLIQNGVPIHPESIARRCGCTPELYTTLLNELSAAGVPGRTSDGIIFNRRMVRDEQDRVANRGRQQKFRNAKRNVENNGPVTPKYEDEDEVEVVAKKKELEPPIDSDRWVEAICGAHPKADFSQAVQMAVIDAIAEESKRQKLPPKDAADYILSRTQLYREMVMHWPDPKMAPRAEAFFKGFQYRQDERIWKGGTSEKQSTISDIASRVAAKHDR